MYFNARSITHKKFYFEELVISKQPDFILITESWLNSHYHDSEFPLSRYNMIRFDRALNRRGGGLLVYVNTAFQIVSAEKETTTCGTESIWCKIANERQTLILACIYRPPAVINSSSSELELDNPFDSLLNSKLTKYLMYPVILCGDFNYPHINWLTNTFPANLDSLRHIIDFFSLTHFYEPTRANAVLDLIFSNPSELISSVSLLEPLHNRDHAVLEADINLPIRITPP